MLVLLKIVFALMYTKSKVQHTCAKNDPKPVSLLNIGVPYLTSVMLNWGAFSEVYRMFAISHGVIYTGIVLPIAFHASITSWLHIVKCRLAVCIKGVSWVHCLPAHAALQILQRQNQTMQLWRRRVPVVFYTLWTTHPPVLHNYMYLVYTWRQKIVCHPKSFTLNIFLAPGYWPQLFDRWQLCNTFNHVCQAQKNAWSWNNADPHSFKVNIPYSFL